jgi:hypothetical protein
MKFINSLGTTLAVVLCVNSVIAGAEIKEFVSVFQSDFVKRSNSSYSCNSGAECGLVASSYQAWERKNPSIVNKGSSTVLTPRYGGCTNSYEVTWYPRSASGTVVTKSCGQISTEPVSGPPTVDEMLRHGSFSYTLGLEPITKKYSAYWQSRALAVLTGRPNTAYRVTVSGQALVSTFNIFGRQQIAQGNEAAAFDPFYWDTRYASCNELSLGGYAASPSPNFPARCDANLTVVTDSGGHASFDVTVWFNPGGVNYVDYDVIAGGMVRVSPTPSPSAAYSSAVLE